MKIETHEQLAALPFGTFVWIVENNDVRRYYICCQYPYNGIKSTLVTYGTNNGCSKWIREHSVANGQIYDDYNSAVDRLIANMESDLEAVKRLYTKD